MQGKVEMALELLTKDEAGTKPAGRGREEPNQNPTLEEPKYVGLQIVISHAVSQSRSLSVSHAVYHLVTQSVSHADSQSVSPTDRQTGRQTDSQTISQLFRFSKIYVYCFLFLVCTCLSLSDTCLSVIISIRLSI